MTKKEEQEATQRFLQEQEERDQEAREIRARAVEYAERVANGEEPWNDGVDAPNLPDVRDDDVEETGGDTVDDGA